MYKKSVSLQATIVATVIGVMSMFVTPQQAAAQGPAGSYRNSCRSIAVARGGYLQAECRAVNGRFQQTRIRVSDCKGRDIANSNGRLICADARRGGNDRGRGDNGPWDTRRGDHDRRDGDRGRRDTPRDTRDRHDRDRSDSRDCVVLFDGTRWSGRRMTIRDDNLNFEKTGFNDVASSIRIVGRGTWRLCAEQNYGGRCVNVSSDVRDLASIGLQNKISSIRQIR